MAEGDGGGKEERCPSDVFCRAMSKMFGRGLYDSVSDRMIDVGL
jgi:hypothetical protein